MKLDNKNSSSVREFEQWVRSELHGTNKQPSHEQPASARVGEWTLGKPLTNQILADDLRRGNTGTISVYGIDIPETGSERVHFGAVLVFGDRERAEQIIESVNQHQHCATQLQYLGNRAEELSSLLAGMTTERDGLREVLRQVRNKARDGWVLTHHDKQEREIFAEIAETADVALNHADEGEGS